MPNRTGPSPDMSRKKDLQRMLREIEEEMRICSGYTGKEALAPRVMSALAATPRHRFVPPELQAFAYENRPLAIGLGQTISQPFIVALMTDLIAPDPGDVVLEIGTGSGYQAAVLARLVKQVYSIETHDELARTARTRLEELGYRNVQVRTGDGHQGWAVYAPYDAIIVTAAAPAIPQPLLDQLKPGGRMVIPVGEFHATQDLQLLTKDDAGKVSRRSILPVAFVPLTGGTPAMTGSGEQATH